MHSRFLTVIAVFLGANFKWNLLSWVFYPCLLMLLLLLALVLISIFRSGFGRETDSTITVAALLFGMMCCFAYFTGAYAAIDDLYVSTSNIYTIEMKSGEPSAVKVLRTFEKGLLQYDTRERATSFIRWDDVKSLRRQQNLDDEKCDSSVLGCRANTPDDWRHRRAPQIRNLRRCPAFPTKFGFSENNLTPGANQF